MEDILNTMNSINGNNNNNDNVYVIIFDVSWTKRLFQIKKIDISAKILRRVYFRIMAFIKAQKLRTHGMPVNKLICRLRYEQWRKC